MLELEDCAVVRTEYRFYEGVHFLVVAFPRELDLPLNADHVPCQEYRGVHSLHDEEKYE